MTVTDADLKRMESLVAPVGERLKVVPPGAVPRLVDGIYVVVRSTGKWALSIYRNVKNDDNETEIAIDVSALVWPSFQEQDRARAWLIEQRSGLENVPSGIHATQPEDAFRIGLTREATWTFLGQLRRQIMERSPTARWALSATPSTPLAATGATEAAPYSPVPLPEEIAVEYMLLMARQACNQSGRATVTMAKSKEFRFASDSAFKAYVLDLLASGRCALTGLQLDATLGDSDLAPSLDRIDSDGHYEPGNLQVVARFVNRWKGDGSDANFKRLVAMVRGIPALPA